KINAEGTTIILTTHYLEEAETLCRHVAIIDEGRIIEDASMADVLRKLNREVFVLTPAEPLDAAPESDEFELTLRPDGDLEVMLEKSRSLNEVFEALSATGVRIVSMRNKANRLEELFMGLVENKVAAAS
ncbi:MAG: ABC transporter ATP-binding protein, partial [Gammaproteobacteria bacterium]